MNDLSQNELLSAYLDGELTAEERAHVEGLLAASPAARQLLDELRTLSATLKSLPRQKLDVDLSESVVRIAQRRMLTEPADTKTGTGALPASDVPEKTILRRLKNPRIWVWEAVIVAVVVLLLIYNPNRDGPQGGHAERNIAMAPKGEEKQSSYEPPNMQAAQPPAMAGRNRETALRNAPDLKAPLDKIAESRQSGSALADKQPVISGAALSVAPGPDKQPVAPDVEKIAGRESAAAPEQSFGGSAGLAKKDIRTLGNKFADQDVPEAALEQAAEQVEPPAEKKLAQQRKVKAASTDELLVVRCEITPEALKNHAFDKLLADNAIVWSESPKENSPGGPVPEPEAIQSLLDQKIDRTADESKRLDRYKSENGNIEPSQAGPLEIVYVEASPAQIEATLNGLSAQTNTFLTVSVAPAKDGARLQELEVRDNRGGDFTKAVRGARGGVVQSEEAAKLNYQTSPKTAQSAVTDGVLGRAQRIALPNATGYGAGGIPARRAGDASRLTGTLGVAGGAATSTAAIATDQLKSPARSLNRPEAAIAPSGTAVSLRMQRVLFVLQVIERKNFSDSSNEATPADATRPNATPAETIPAK